jgi:mycothiol synthase
MTELAIEQSEPIDYPAIFQLFRKGVSNWERRLQLDALQLALQREKAGHFVTFHARRVDQIVGWVVAQPQPGRVASVWGPSSLTTEPEATRQQLHQRLCEEMRSRGIRMLQASLPLDEDEARSTLLQLNYQPLARLAYLTLSLEMTPQPQSDHPASDPAPYKIVPFDPDRWQDLEQVMAETYAGSLDCPKLNGLRSAKEVLEGYRAAEGFDPGLWFRIREGKRDVGCLLLAARLEDRSWELVYWGLIPAVRRRGWGEHLLRWVVNYARSEGVNQLALTVDEDNVPAWRVCQRVGFQPRARRQVFIQSV